MGKKLKITLTTESDEFYTSDEAVSTMKLLLGSSSDVTVLPASKTPEDFIYFGLRNLMAVDQLDVFFNYYPHGYPDKVDELRTRILGVVETILDQVIEDVEAKVRE